MFNAVAAGDQASLERLCAAHEDAVVAAFRAWQTVPVEFRTPDKLPWYGNGLIAVAQHLAARGRPELMRALRRDGENPLQEWEDGLIAAGRLMEELRFSEAAARLRAVLQASAGLQGSGVDSYLPITLGRLGECLFQCGDAEGARESTERALELCERSGEGEGVMAYLGNLFEIHRYLGDGAGAATYLERLAAALVRRDPARAGLMRRHAAIVRAGEPLCRVVAQVDGQLVELSELSELPPSPGHVHFGLVRNRPTLRLSSVAVAAGAEAAGRGELQAALQHFQRAAAADLYDPWPRYHAAMAFTELRRYREAIENLQATEALAPGWYKCRSDLWLAERLATGAIDHETFVALRKISDGGLAPAEAVACADVALRRCELGPLHLGRGNALARLRRIEDARDAYRAGLAITDEPDTRTCLLVGLAAIAPDSPECAGHLHEAIELSGNLTAAAQAAVMLRSRTAS
ncbi:MAG: tetratricopeptide repeat protein [Kofleriaceae bacterium]